jgi:serine/threonine protein phosphatase 1
MAGLVERLRGLARRPAAAATVAAVPPGRRVYAVGDIHGRADLLDRLTRLIAEDAAAHPEAAPLLVYLGDYVDRGAQSREVLDRLIEGPPPGFEAVHLLGNHELAMLRFLDDVAIGPTWFAYGGMATLLSFGIRVTASALEGGAGLQALQARLRARLSTPQLAFLRSLELTHVEGDYLFVHAGIRPGVPLDRQSPDDLLQIREEFLRSPLDHGKVVVHGHTVTAEPEIRANRIGIDTGAYATGRLSCLVLEGNRRAFLHT